MAIFWMFLGLSSPSQHLARLAFILKQPARLGKLLLAWVFHKSRLVEFISTMAVGWNSQLIVETWSQGGLIATTVGLAVVRSHTCRRHVCIVSDE
ncbi:hypothetical protein JHK87_050177 [Glycine soja]|nr:hypothetical protein JHK87_050177 [Glycine soja]